MNIEGEKMIDCTTYLVIGYSSEEVAKQTVSKGRFVQFG